jgi:hypothetical protein
MDGGICIWAEDGRNRVWVLMGLRKVSVRGLILWEGVVEEFEWLLHMCVAQIKEYHVGQLNDFPDQTLT